jgi:DeoR family transcriptional regulator, aga operon transcriptional repressor
MRKAERITAILDRLATTGSASVNELASEYGVSRATLRLEELQVAAQRLLDRTHGGAVADTEAYELPLRYRDAQQRDAKRAIAREAVRRVPTDGAVIGLTGGTTTTEVARIMADRAGLTVVTNAINIGALLAVRPRLKLIMTGGVARPQSYELVGPLAEATVAGLNIEITFVGVDGLDPIGGVTTHDEIEAHTDAALLRASKRVIVVADGSKIGRVRLARIAPPSAVHELITDQTADRDVLAQLEAGGMVVTVVD